MYKIAICDDDKLVCSFIENVLLNYKKESKADLEVEVFTSGESLYCDLDAGATYDLVFLDIELKLMNGVELGRKIREDLKNELVTIIYISAKSDYALELFESRPLNFLVKPINKDEIIKNVKKDMELSGRLNRQFIFNIGRKTIKLAFSDIMYFMSDAKKVTLVARDQNYEFYDKLSEVIKRLPESEFLFIHKSYIVNYNYVKQHNYDTLLMASDVELGVSQSYRKKVKEFFVKKRKE